MLSFLAAQSITVEYMYKITLLYFRQLSHCLCKGAEYTSALSSAESDVERWRRRDRCCVVLSKESSIEMEKKPRSIMYCLSTFWTLSVRKRLNLNSGKVLVKARFFGKPVIYFTRELSTQFGLHVEYLIVFMLVWHFFLYRTGICWSLLLFRLSQVHWNSLFKRWFFFWILINFIYFTYLFICSVLHLRWWFISITI